VVDVAVVWMKSPHNVLVASLKILFHSRFLCFVFIYRVMSPV